MRVLLVAAFLAAATVTVSSHAAAGRDARTDASAFWTVTGSELRLRGTVDSIAADGRRVAFGACRVVGGTWEPGQAARFFLADPAADACTNPTEARSFGPFAVAGQRVAFWETRGGIGVYGGLWTVAVHNDYALHGIVFPATCCSGDPVGSLRWGDLVGGGDTIVYAHWDFCGTYTCDGGRVHVSREVVRLVLETCNSQAGFDGCPQVESASDAAVPLAADSAHVVLRRGNGSLELRTPAGNLLRTLRSAGGEPLDAALAGRTLVVLVPGALRVFDTRTGRAEGSWPIQGAPLGGVCTQLPYQCAGEELELAGTAHGLAAYVGAGMVHVVRLVDGTDVVLARGEQARLTAAGLFYAYRGADPWPGRVRFVARSALFGALQLPGSPAPSRSHPDLFAQAALQLIGSFPASHAGSTAAAAGDVNGDGRPDVLVGAERASPRGRLLAGSAFVVFGSRRARAVQLDKLGSRGIRIDLPGRTPGALRGVVGLGDVTGDRRSDIAVAESPSTVWIVPGTRRAGAVDLASPGARAVPITGFSAPSVAAAGDVNGDGLRDVLVCCASKGDSAVVFGARSFSRLDINALGRRGFRITGLTGATPAGAGDMNGDGLADVALADPYLTGKTYVVNGKRGVSPVDVRTLGTAGLTITQSRAPHDVGGPGLSLAGLYDVNGDKLADVSVATANEGTAVVFGSRTRHAVDLDALGRAGFFIRANPSAVPAATPAGDINGDGLADIAVGSPKGIAVVYGRRGTRAVDLTRRFSGFTLASPLLWGGVGVGDENGDGQPDLLVAAPFGSNGGPETGTAYVFSRDVRAPRVRVDVGRSRPGVALHVSCNEPCTVSARGTPRLFVADPRHGATLRVRSRLRNVVVRAVDRAGNATRAVVRL